MKLQANRDIRSKTRGSFAAGEVFDIDEEAGRLWVKQGLASIYIAPSRAGRRSYASRPAPALLPPIADVSEPGEATDEASSPSTSASDSHPGPTFYTPPTSSGGDSTD